MDKKGFETVLEEIRGSRILVANRGIPARRIVRTIHELKAVPVLTVTDADKAAPFTVGAQELLRLGPNPRAYLDVDFIVSLAKSRDITAIHPGWGFASEVSRFPKKCKEAGIRFIGPTAEAMQLLGNKVEVRNLGKLLGIPVIPGSDGAVTVDEAKKIARTIGYPIMLKAESGGGGRGIVEVFEEDRLEDAFRKASVLAESSFGNDALYVEKLLTSVRHIEIQVIGDMHGNVFAFDERDCTLQRNHQKLVEITPSPWTGMTQELRERLKEYSRTLIRKTGYWSLATVEFLVDAEGNPYLIEVNTRLQVEHGITECRYGIDLVEDQIAIAFGAPLRYDAEKTQPSNYAMQVRINFEDPQSGFSPNAGLITRYLSPGGQGVRLDTCIASGYAFPSHYDSAAGLLISYAKTWQKVLRIMERALNEYAVGGVKTTIPFHENIIRHPLFRVGTYDTNFVSQTPSLLDYRDRESEHLRLSRLVAEISARGYNPFIQLGQYRGREDKRLGRSEPVFLAADFDGNKSPYPRGDRRALLDFIRDSDYVHFMDTTCRDITQSNSGNRFRLAEDVMVAPYLDNCGFFSIENGGGAHFHVAMLSNMTYPFTEGAVWNRYAPKTLKQILIRSTNVLGYKPQPRNLMNRTGEMICENYDVIRCFDFLNHIENMRPFAELALNSNSNVFEPAVSLSWAKGFDIPHYMNVVDEIIAMVANVSGTSTKKALELFILGLKDMAGVCPPRFMRELVGAIRKKYPSLVIHYHRHYTDGLFVPAVGAAAQAGAHIVDTAIGAAVRWYGQGEVLSTAAYLEDELGLKTRLNREMIRACGFVLKQIMPYYDRYVAPYFQGIDYDVVEHGMPGGATSSSQEGALQQGYIHLLPYMLRFLSGTRKIVRYHDVTPGSQITWNTAFLAVTQAYKRGGEKEVNHLLQVLESVIHTPEADLEDSLKRRRLMLYRESNDAFRDLLLGKFGRMPLGFPPDWVYESAFGSEYKQALEQRTEDSPLNRLADIDFDAERASLSGHLGRDPSEEELVMYMNHPGDALKTIEFRQTFGDPNRLPLDVWFEGLEPELELPFLDSREKLHHMTILDISSPDDEGMALVRYVLDGENFTHPVKVAEAVAAQTAPAETADPGNPFQVGSPTNGDLWVMYVKPGDMVKKGEELFNITVMKQEIAVVAPVSGMVKRVLKYADYQADRKMVPVRERELIVELGVAPHKCTGCEKPIPIEGCKYCPECGAMVEGPLEAA